MAIKNQILLSNYSWLDKCNKETFKTWTIPNPIKSNYTDGEKREFLIEFNGFSFHEFLSVSSGREIYLPSHLSQIIETEWEQESTISVVFTALDLPGSPKIGDEIVDSSSTKGWDVLRTTKVRLGHTKFKEELINYWGNKCAVLELKNPAGGKFLIASHIIPWSIANENDKVQQFNGLLLSPHLDRLFDAGYISFDDHGKLLYKPEYSELLEQMAIPSDSKLRKLDKKHIPFLRKHREIFGFE